MRFSRQFAVVSLAALAALAAAPAARAHVLHTVAPGETLWSIAAQSNLTTRTVAVYNGLSPDAHVVLGSTLKVPSVAEGAAALAAAGVAPAAAAPGTTSTAGAPGPASAAAAPGTTSTAGAPGPASAAAAPGTTSTAAAPGPASAAAAPGTTSTAAAPGPASAAAAPGVAAQPALSAPSPGAPRPQGAYVVRAGDTLSALAAQTGVSVAQMAWMNGLDPARLLLIGTLLKLPNGAPAPAGASTPLPAARVVPQAAPLPSAGRLGAERIRQLAVEHGAPASLAAAIAWQESGFNNALVSSANARGIMQVMPGTWDYVQRNLGLGPLSPTSPEDNVRAGSAYLARLLRDAGGDVRLAAAGYYQGLHSVRTRGMFEDTKRYVDNVLALRARFGG